MADTVEQALRLLGDMADLRSLRKHEVFLSLERDLTLISPLIGFLIFRIIIALSNLCIFSSLKGCPSCAQS